MKENKEIAITTQQVNNFTNFSSMEEMLTFSNQIAKSGLSPLKKGDDVLCALLMGKELGFEPMASINNIYPINGKASLGLHIITAILLKNKITYKILENYTPIIGFKNKGLANEEKAIIDYRTTIEFNRLFKRENGTFKEMEIIYSYSITDAKTAGLLTKDNWIRMPKQMVFARCMSGGSRQIADDILLGCLTTDELAEINNVPFKVTEDGNVTIMETKINESKLEESEEVVADLEVNLQEEQQEEKQN